MSKSKLQFLQAIWSQRTALECFDSKVYRKVSIVSGGDGTCEAEFKVEPEHTNPVGFLHGGFSACLVDTISTMALMTHPREVPGVSVNMNMTYLKAAHIGDMILVKAKTDRVGKNLAFLSVEIINKDTSALIAQGTHTKYIP